MRVLALDVGDKRIGIAAGDTESRLATPIDVYRRVGGQRDLEAIQRIAEQQRADAILVGMPFSLDGSEGYQAVRVRNFCESLQAQISLPLMTRDERFTTVEADRLMLQSGLSAAKRATLRDAAAAAVILQSYFDAQAATPSGAGSQPA